MESQRRLGQLRQAPREGEQPGAGLHESRHASHHADVNQTNQEW